jgi:signal transduction histidine kinase
MPETYLKNWGQILGKAAQLNTARGGSGIGLYSIRSIIEAHKKATVELKSIVGEGSTFILEFPQR